MDLAAMALLNSISALLLLLMTAMTSTAYSPVEAGSVPTNDLAPLLRIHHQTETFTKAQEYLDTLRAKPVCHHVAALDLVRSCEDLGEKTKSDSTGDFERIRDAVKTKFTIRLALCEINDAQAQIPKDCSRFLPSTKACSFSGQWGFGKRQSRHADALCYPQSDSTHMKKCLAGLWTGPQSWTSYSNAQQNAILVCQATHETRQKDRLLDVLTSAVEVNGRLAAANEETIHRQHAAQNAFDTALADFSATAKLRVEEMTVQSSSAIDNILEAARAALAQIYRGVSEAATSMTRLEEGLSANHVKAVQLDRLLVLMHKDVEQSRTDDALLHSSQLQSAHASFEHIMLMIRQSVTEELDPLRARIESITDGAHRAITSLDTFNEGLNRSQEILEQHNAYAEETYGKVQHLMAAFGGYGIFRGVSVALCLLAAHLALKMALGNSSATLFACVFATVSATHLFGPAYSTFFPGLSGPLRKTSDFVINHSRAFVVLCLFLVIAMAILKLGIDGVSEWPRANCSASDSAQTLPTIAPRLYNPASPPYSPSTHRLSSMK